MVSIKDVLVLPLPVGHKTHSLSMDLHIHQKERQSATDQKILSLIFMATTFIQLSQNRHRYNRQASGGVVWVIFVVVVDFVLPLYDPIRVNTSTFLSVVSVTILAKLDKRCGHKDK